MSRLAICFFFLCIVPFALSAQTNPQPLIIGETFSFRSEVLDQERQINVYLPEGYHADSAQRYPVLYVLDGGMGEDFLHLVGIIQFGAFSWIDRNPRTIVVGVVNIDRQHDFVYPTSLPDYQKEIPTAGGAADFLAFLKTELQPVIDRRYKTNGTRTLLGQSLGGLFATYVLHLDPEAFDSYLIVSPSIWWDKESLLQQPLPAEAITKRVAIAVGKEGPVMQRTAKQLYQKLKKAKMKMVTFQFFPACDHGDVLHKAGYWGLEWL